MQTYIHLLILRCKILVGKSQTLELHRTDVGIMWPGTFSMAAASVKRGGTALFALLALAGDVGCSSGPTYVGMISGALNDNLKLGIFAALIFPVLMIMGIKMIGSLQKYD